MAGWNNATMTDVGEALQAKVNAGLTKLTFTKIKVGSGVSTTNAQALTDVIASKWETTNFTVKRDGKIVTVDTFITNTGITEAFRMTEIGLFARDPDKGEVLYAYLTDSEPDRMPAEGGSTVVSQELSLGMTFSNSGNVTLTVNMGALVTREQLEQHNSDPNAHGGLLTRVQNEVKVATDALAAHNTADNAHAAKFAKYLPLIGGNMSGDITINTHLVDYIIEEGSNGRNWYAKWKSGRMEQFVIVNRYGTSEDTGNISGCIITLMQPFKDTDYIAVPINEMNGVRDIWSNQNSASITTGAGFTNSNHNQSKRTTTSVTVSTDKFCNAGVYCVGRWK